MSPMFAGGHADEISNCGCFFTVPLYAHCIFVRIVVFYDSLVTLQWFLVVDSVASALDEINRHEPKWWHYDDSTNVGSYFSVHTQFVYLSMPHRKQLLSQ